MILPSGWLVLLRLYLPASAQHFHRRRSAASQCPRFRPGNPQKLTQEIQVCPASIHPVPSSSILQVSHFGRRPVFGWICPLAQPTLGYFLAKLWERDFKDEGSVITESIVNHNMGLAPALGVKVEALQEQLNALEAYGIIEHDGLCLPFR